VADAGRADATVVSVLFKGDHSVVSVRRDGDSDDALLESVVATAAGVSWRPGDRVVVDVDPSGVQQL
jgi:hypothetical protein